MFVSREGETSSKVPEQSCYMIKAATPQEQHTILHVEPEDVFNLSLFEYRFLIDCRSPEAFSQEKIVSAFSFPFTSINELDRAGNQRFANLLRSIEDLGTPEHLSPIVLYGDVESSGNVLWLSTKLQQLQSIKENDLKNMLQTILAREGALEMLWRILRPETKIWVLKGGFNAFKEEFPILCGCNITLENSRSLPAAITRGVFLGSRDTNSLERRERGQLGYDLNTLRGLRVSHAVVNASAPLDLEDSSGLLCLRIDAADSEDEDSSMSEYWTAACEFIAEARSKGGRVLINFHGRSRGASFAVAWAMYFLRLDFSAALAYVRGRVFYRLDPTLMYLKQLSEWSHPAGGKPSPPKLLQ